jgi:hypothetical protein
MWSFSRPLITFIGMYLNASASMIDPTISPNPILAYKCTCGPIGARWTISTRVPQGSVM